MFTRKEVAEERKAYAKKKKAYTHIGILQEKDTRRSTNSGASLRNFGFNKLKNTSPKKNALFSLDDGSTSYIRVSEYMALKMDKKLQLLDVIIASLTFLNLLIWTIENETFYKNNWVLNTRINTFRISYLVISIAIILLIYPRTYFFIERQKHRGAIRVDVSVSTRKYFLNFILEIIINAISPLPGLDVIFKINQRELYTPYSLDGLMYLFCFVKLYWFKRIFDHFSMFSNNKAHKICQFYHKEASTSFAIRGHIAKHPFLFETLLTLMVVLLSCVPLRIFERVLTDSNGAPSELNKFENDMWVMTLVASTIGYGELVPETNLGRITTAIACYIGVCLLSLLIVSMSNFLVLDRREMQAYCYIKRGDNFKNYQIAAANFIKMAMKYAFLRKKQKTKKNSKLLLDKRILEIILLKKHFKTARIALKDSEEGSNQILESIRDQTYIDFGMIRKRINKLNIDKYEKFYVINEEAKETFQKVQQSLTLSQGIAKSLENMILENQSKTTNFLQSPLDSDETQLRINLQQMKRECFAHELISKREITHVINHVLKRYNMEPEVLKANNITQMEGFTFRGPETD